LWPYDPTFIPSSRTKRSCSGSASAAAPRPTARASVFATLFQTPPPLLTPRRGPVPPFATPPTPFLGSAASTRASSRPPTQPVACCAGRSTTAATAGPFIFPSSPRACPRPQSLRFSASFTAVQIPLRAHARPRRAMRRGARHARENSRPLAPGKGNFVRRPSHTAAYGSRPPPPLVSHPHRVLSCITCGTGPLVAWVIHRFAARLRRGRHPSQKPSIIKAIHHKSHPSQKI
jgi:hypothetical protein